MNADDSIPLSSTSENPPMTAVAEPLPSSSFSSSSPSPPAPPSLDQVERLLLALLTSSSALLSQLSTIQPSSPPLATPHAHSFLTSLSQLRAGLLHCMSHGASERTYRRSAYSEQLALDVEAEASERISERLEDIELWVQRWSERQEVQAAPSAPAPDHRMDSAG